MFEAIEEFNFSIHYYIATIGLIIFKDISFRGFSKLIKIFLKKFRGYGEPAKIYIARSYTV